MFAGDNRTRCRATRTADGCALSLGATWQLLATDRRRQQHCG
jgi:hypothetical protein